MNARLQAYGFMPLAVLLLALELAWTGGLAWYHFNCLREDFRAVQSESFHLAEHVEEKMLALNETLRRWGARPDPALAGDFRRQAAEMKLWVRTNRLSVTSGSQRDLFNRIEAALDDYVASTTRILEENMRVGSGAQPESVLERVEKEASLVLGLGGELRAEEQAALERFFKESRGFMGDLYKDFVLAVVVALALGLAALRLIQVARIVPLKEELVESHSILEQQEKLASLGALAAGVAHEVRNPLTAIKVRLHGLKRATRGDPSAEEDLGVIEDEIKRLERFVGDFLEFARPSAARMQTIAAAALFEQLTRLLGAQLEKAGIRLKTEASPELRVRADPQQIEQVLMGLIQNAAEDTGRGGTITLRAGTCQARGPSGIAAGTVLEVADTGRGITPEVAKHMFDPFYTTKEHGTGLGLAIAARIVGKHGGQIQFQTKVGKGTTFSVILPSPKEDKHET